MTTQQEADERRRLERAREIALFRYSLIQEVISPHFSAAQRGARVRQLAAMAHAGPDGTGVRVSHQSINRWKRAYLAGGFEALVPAPRQASPRTPAEVLDLAAALKRENPERTAAQVQRILRASSGWAPSDRTLQRLFTRLELNTPPADEASQRVFGRFEADPLPSAASRSHPAVASHAIGFAEPRHDVHSPGLGAYEDDGQG